MSGCRALRSLAMASLLAALPAALLAAGGARAATVLVVKVKQAAQYDEALAAFKEELGQPYVELTIDDTTKPATIARRVAEQDVAAIVAVGARAAQLAAAVTTTPLVSCMVLQDAAVPDTPQSVGVSLAIAPRRQLGALLRIAPKIKRVGLLYDPRFNDAEARAAETAATAMGLKLLAKQVFESKDAVGALDALAPDIDALLLLPDATVVSKAFLQYLTTRAFERRLPVLAYSESFVRLGLLASVSPSYAQNGKLAAQIVKRVLAGEAPVALRGSVAMHGVLSINVSTAQRLAITVAPDVLLPPTQLVGAK